MRPPPPIGQMKDFPATGGTMVLAIVATAASFLGASHGGSNDPTVALRMNYLAFHGQPWRLVTSVFPHANILHLVFNLYWVWAFGTLVEQQFGHLRTLALYLLLAVGSSMAEYAFGSGGIGLSGVGYGLFGFVWALSRYDRRFFYAVDKNTVGLFVGWFFFCIFLTVRNIMPIGNYAHGGGAILGGLIGLACAKSSPWRRPALAAVVLAFAAVTWGATIGRPLVNFSRDGSQDVSRLGYEALERGDNAESLRLLKLATSMRYADQYAWNNLGVAYDRTGNHEMADAAFRRARELGLEQPRSNDENSSSQPQRRGSGNTEKGIDVRRH